MRKKISVKTSAGIRAVIRYLLDHVPIIGSHRRTTRRVRERLMLLGFGHR